LSDRARIFEKSFFDACKDKTIKSHLGRLKRRQVLVAGCETDVCVFQSCLGLLRLGYQVYVVEELIFSSSSNVQAATTHLKDRGVVFLSYKSLYYELVESVDGPPNRKGKRSFPDELPDTAGR
jgi:nicotinamidase-related amidase